MRQVEGTRGVMRRLMTLGLLAVLALGAACATDPQPEPAPVAMNHDLSAAPLPDYPKVRVAAMVEDTGDLALAIDWLDYRIDEWQRIRVGKVSAQRLENVGCFSASTGTAIGRQNARVKVIGCIRGSGKIDLYLQGGREGYGLRDTRYFQGGIPAEQRAASGGKWIIADKGHTTFTLVGSAPVRPTPNSIKRTTPSKPSRAPSALSSACDRANRNLTAAIAADVDGDLALSKSRDALARGDATSAKRYAAEAERHYDRAIALANRSTRERPSGCTWP